MISSQHYRVHAISRRKYDQAQSRYAYDKMQMDHHLIVCLFWYELWEIIYVPFACIVWEAFVAHIHALKREVDQSKVSNASSKRSTISRADARFFGS